MFIDKSKTTTDLSLTSTAVSLEEAAANSNNNSAVVLIPEKIISPSKLPSKLATVCFKKLRILFYSQWLMVNRQYAYTSTKNLTPNTKQSKNRYSIISIVFFVN